MKYAEKLKDPRWQKKRLEILEDHGWTCDSCFDTESTLHVHHKVYFNGYEPWEYENHIYAVLCDGCHSNEHSSINLISACMSRVLRSRFLSSQLTDISAGFNYIKIPHTNDVVASAIGWALSNEEMMGDIVERYFESIRVVER